MHHVVRFMKRENTVKEVTCENHSSAMESVSECMCVYFENPDRQTVKRTIVGRSPKKFEWFKSDGR